MPAPCHYRPAQTIECFPIPCHSPVQQDARANYPVACNNLSIGCVTSRQSPVERADAASRLTIHAINSIGTAYPGTTLPLLPDTAENSALINASNRLTVTPYGLFLESRQPQGYQPQGYYQPSTFFQVPVEFVFSHFYNFREVVYVCRERHLEHASDVFQGNFFRVVYEDCPATLHPEGSPIEVVGLGQLKSLPVFDSSGLVEWCACDSDGNVFALKGYRLGSCQNYELMPFKPTRPGIGPLKPVKGRTPEVILDTDPLFVLENPKANLTFINLCNGLTGMDWKVLKGHTTGIVSRKADDLTDWQQRERLLDILASATSQDVKLDIWNTSVEDNLASLVLQSHDNFLEECRLMGMSLPPSLKPHTLLLEQKTSSRKARFPYFTDDGSVVGFDVQNGLASSVALARIIIILARVAGWCNILVIFPDDLAYEVKRALFPEVTVELCPASAITSVERFNRAVHEAKADVVLMFGFKINTNASYIQRILQWGAERPVPIGCIYFGDNNNLNADDYYLYDTIFNVSTPPKNAKAGLVQFLRKHPDSAKLCLDENGKTVDEARPPENAPKTAKPTLSELYGDLML